MDAATAEREEMREADQIANEKRGEQLYLDHWREFRSIAMLISAAKVALGIPTDLFREQDFLEKLVVDLVVTDADSIASGYVIVSKQTFEGEEPTIQVSLDLGEVVVDGSV